MNPAANHERGYSLIELIVVLAIIGILAVAGLTALGNRPTLAVRANLDEIEGVIMGAQKLAMAKGGQDVYLVANGVWDPKAPGGNPFILAYDVMKPADGGNPANTVQRIVDNTRNPAGAATPGDLPEGTYQLRFDAATKAVSREQGYAGVVVANSAWYDTARGAAPDLRTVSPGNVAPLSVALDLANNLCQGGANGVAVVSGISKRWNRDFHICVAGLRSGNAVPDCAVGFVVVPANSATVYKFINLGTKDSDGTWRRM